MRFTRLKLDNWRNFKKVDVVLGERVFVFGPNASGKSNLLDAFRFLRDIAEEQGGLKRAVDDMRRGLRHIRSVHATRNTDVTVCVSVELDPGEPAWEYALTLTSDRGRVQVKSERVQRGGEVLLERPDADDRRDRARLSQTHLEQVSANQTFRPLAEFFASVEYIHIVPQLVRRPELVAGPVQTPFGTQLLEQIARTPQRNRNSKLRRINKVLQAALPQFLELALERDEVGRPHLAARYEHWRRSGTWQREDQFSDGTLRLIGLLWDMLDGTAPLLLEEPELSLHASVVRQLPRMMNGLMRRSGRQVLLSTHSEHLMADRGIDPSEVLILDPTGRETHIWLASDYPEICAVAEAGQPIADILVAVTQPENVANLGRFED